MTGAATPDLTFGQILQRGSQVRAKKDAEAARLAADYAQAIALLIRAREQLHLEDNVMAYDIRDEIDAMVSRYERNK